MYALLHTHMGITCGKWGCREAEGQEPIPGMAWGSVEFHVKWKRYAYVHCSWDTRATLSQLGGYKRVINYMKKYDDLQVQTM